MGGVQLRIRLNIPLAGDRIELDRHVQWLGMREFYGFISCLPGHFVLLFELLSLWVGRH